MERYIIVIEKEGVYAPLGWTFEIRYATETEIERALEDPNDFLPDCYSEDADGDLWVAAAVHRDGSWVEPRNDRRTFETAENLLVMTGTPLLRGQYEGIVELLGAKREAVAHVVDKRVRRVAR